MRVAGRERAGRELAALGERAEPALARALQGPLTLGARRRVEKLLSKLGGPVPTSDELRALRAVHVLEQIGTPEARQVLRVLADGGAGATLTLQAAASLQRLDRRPPGTR